MNPNNNDQQNTSQPVMDVQRPRQLFEAPAALPEQPVTSPSQPPLQQQPMPSSNTSKGPRKGLIAVIVISVLVTLLLIGAAVFVFLRSKKTAPAAQTTTTQATPDDGKVDETDIDNANSEIDNAIKTLNDSEDFGPDDLSDKTIGL